MFSFRDSIAATLLGIQIPANDAPSNDVSQKKGKKKSNKKKAPKKKKQDTMKDENDDNDDGFESLSDGSASDIEIIMPSVGVTSTQSTTAADAKVTSALLYQFESTQIEDPLQIMIKKLAVECNVEVLAVSETVNRMFECGLKYDSYDAVRKELQAKGKKKSSNAKPGPEMPIASAGISTIPVVSGNTVIVKAEATTVAPPSSTVSRTAADVDAAAALAKLNGSSLSRSKHNKEISVVTNTESTPSITSTAAEPVLHSMKEKLNFVANFSKTSLYDSLAALCSWAAVSLTASPANAQTLQTEREQKMEAFFQSQALEILLATMFADDSQQLSTRPEVNSAFQSLLHHILLLQQNGAPHPAGAAAVHNITESLCGLIAQIHGLRSAQVMPAFASAAAHGHTLLAQQVASCIQHQYAQLNFPAASNANRQVSTAGETSASSNEDLMSKLAEADAQLSALEKPVAAGSKRADPALEKVQNMFLAREIHSDKMQLCIDSAQVLATAPAGRPSHSSAVSVPPIGVTAADLSRNVADSTATIERTLLSECNLLLNGSNSPVNVSRIAPGSAAASLQSKHQQSHSINSSFERMSYERDAKLSVLSNELNSNNMRIQEVTAHRKRLLDQIQMCDQELGNLSARGNSLTNDLNASTFYYQQQLDQLAQTGSSVRKSLIAHDQVNSLLGAVRSFETKFTEALLQQRTAQTAAPISAVSSSGMTILTSTTAGLHVKSSGGISAGSNANSSADEHRAQLEERLLLLSSSLRGYVAAEAQCVGFLSERVQTAQLKLVSAKKELLAYAALSMKGSVVQTAETLVAQMDAEISEDQQAVRQLLHNITEFLGQIKTLQSSLNTSKDRAISRSSAAESSVVDMPAVEFANIVRYCAAIGVAAPAEITSLVGTAVPTALPAASVVPAATVTPAAVATTNAPVVASSYTTARAGGTAKVSRDRAAPAGKSNATATGRQTGDRDSKKRGSPTPESSAAAKSSSGKCSSSSVDTRSAIEQLEKSCLQKSSVGNAPVKAASSPADDSSSNSERRPVPAPKPVAPINSVWGKPVAAASGVAESKSREGAKQSLKEIQEEQRREKLVHKQKQQQQSQQSHPSATTKESVAVAVPAAAIVVAAAVAEESASPTETQQRTEPSARPVTDPASSSAESSPSKSPRKSNRKKPSGAQVLQQGAETTSKQTETEREVSTAAAVAMIKTPSPSKTVKKGLKGQPAAKSSKEEKVSMVTPTRSVAVKAESSVSTESPTAVTAGVIENSSADSTKKIPPLAVSGDPSSSQPSPEIAGLQSPLVEFHHTYPSLDEHVPVHESMEGGDFPVSAVAGAVEASPLVEFHTTYPGSRRDRHDEGEPDTSGDERDRSFTFEESSSSLLNTTVSTVNSYNSTNSNISGLRDINPLSRPSPGKSSFRIKLAMSQANSDAELEPSTGVVDSLPENGGMSEPSTGVVDSLLENGGMSEPSTGVVDSLPQDSSMSVGLGDKQESITAQEDDEEVAVE